MITEIKKISKEEYIRQGSVNRRSDKFINDWWTTHPELHSEEQILK